MTGTKPSRVALVSDQAIFLRGLASFVMTLPDVTLIGEARNSMDAMQLCQLSEPEIILISLNNPPEADRELARQISGLWPNMKIILLLSSMDESQCQEENDEPHWYCLSKEVSEEEFASAIGQIQRGPAWSQEVAKSAYASFESSIHKVYDEEVSDLLPHTKSPVVVRNHELMARELIMAGKIQADILPEEVPAFTGWDISVRLVPARETSGDFYDFLPLNERKLGLVVADVTDKGMGAALFMALSSTLFRTFATRFPSLPALALSAVSERILSDTRGSTFVTAFFGILEQHTGRVIYANAGHPPGYLIRMQKGKVSIDPLRPTGMALGVSDQARWKQKVVKMNPGDFLVLYTDGITEAQNSRGEFFGEEKLLDVALSKIGCPANVIQDALLEAVHQFVGHHSSLDDIALLVIRRLEV